MAQDKGNATGLIADEAQRGRGRSADIGTADNRTQHNLTFILEKPVVIKRVER